MTRELRSPPMLAKRPGVAVGSGYQTERSAGLDVARFMAATGIVWLHTLAINPAYRALSAAGRFAVPFFVLTAVMLLGQSVRRSPRRRWANYAWSRFLRVYGPFLVWTVLYVLLRDAKDLLQGKAMVEIGPYLLLGGAAHHLWFLPFILLLSVVSFPLAGWLVKRGNWTVATALVVAGVGIALVVSPGEPKDNVPVPTTLAGEMGYLTGLGLATMPAVLWGMALIIAGDRPRQWAQRSGWWIATAGMVGVGVGIVVAVMWRRDSLVENATGVCLLAATLGPWRGAVVDFVAYLGQRAYGIYLVHIAVLLGLEMVVVRQRTTVGVGRLVMLCVAAVVVSCVISVALGRSKWTRWLAL